MKTSTLKLTALLLCSTLIGPRLYAAEGSTADKENYQARISGTKAGAVALYVAGAAGAIGGIAIMASGINQRNNAEFKQKGNIITNEDDINAGNDKVLKGSAIELGGVLLIVGGLFMSQHARHLENEAMNKGISLSFIPTSHGTGGMLAYAQRF